MDAADYHKLMARGVSPNWTAITDNKSGFTYVCVFINGSTVTNSFVSRLILGTKKGGRVTFLNGDRLDLRRGNLHVAKVQQAKQRSKRAGPAALRKAQAATHLLCDIAEELKAAAAG